MDNRIMSISGKEGKWNVIFRGKKYLLGDKCQSDALADVCMTVGVSVFDVIFKNDSESWTA